MRILITGGAGCLGTNLIEHFYSQNHEFFVIDNFATGKREILTGVDRVKIIEGSIADVELVNRCFDEFQPTHVIHSAASYKDTENWGEDAATNVVGTINVANASIRHQVKRLINFQTALCYGRPTQLPVPVTHAQQPFTSYGISKTAGEQYLLELATNTIQLVSFRLANVTGPRLAIGPIPTFYQRLKAKKACFCSETVRDFIDMSDFLALMELALIDDAPTGVFNVSTGIGHSIKDIFEAVVEHLNITLAEDVKVVAPGADDVSAVVLDPTKTVEAFGWNAKVDFEETMRKILCWYDEFGVTDIYSHLSSPDSKS